MDVSAKQRLCLETCVVIFGGLGGGFAPRHLRRSSGLVTIQNVGDVEIDADLDGYFNIEGVPCGGGPYLTSEVCENQTEKEAKEENSAMLIPPCGECESQPRYFEPDVGITSRPTITSITPNQAVVGSNIDVIISGNGFRPGLEFVPVQGIVIYDIDVLNSTQISAKFQIAENAAGGNRSIQVKVLQIVSSGKNFFVQIPTKVRRDEFTNIVIREKRPGDFVNIFGETTHTNVCGAFRNIKYTLLDQASNPILQELSVSEILTDFIPSDPGIPVPQPKNTTTNDEGIFGDQIAVAYAPPCDVPPFNYTLKQRFKVTVGQSMYNLTTLNDVSVSKTAPAQWTINVTITTP